MDPNNDVALLEKFRETKDPAIFKSLVRPFQDRIYNAAYRILGNAEEAEEVVQDTYIKVHQGIDKFNKSNSFAAWVFRIAHNSCLDTIRFRQRKRTFQTLAFDTLASPDGETPAEGSGLVVCQAADPGPGPAELLDKDEQGKFIAAKLNELPDNQRAVLVLHDIEGFSYQEIADIVGEKIGTVRSRLHYGRLKLRELLEPYYSSGMVSRA